MARSPNSNGFPFFSSGPATALGAFVLSCGPVLSSFVFDGRRYRMPAKRLIFSGAPFRLSWTTWGAGLSDYVTKK